MVEEKQKGGDRERCVRGGQRKYIIRKQQEDFKRMVSSHNHEASGDTVPELGKKLEFLGQDAGLCI